MDFIFTVCGSAAAETCPIWPGHPQTGHWGLPDPAFVEGQAMKEAAFEAVYLTLSARIEGLLRRLDEGLPAPEWPSLLRQLASDHP